jgi:hypothetical protein
VTTQDIYPWIQIMLLVVIGGGLTWYIRLLKNAVDAQKVTIDALKTTIGALDTQIRDQSTVLQDFARLNEMMKRVIDTVSDPAVLKREQAYRERVDRDAAALVAQQVKEVEEKHVRTVSEVRDAYSDRLHDFINLAGRMLPFVPPDVRRTLIDATGLSLHTKDVLRELEASAPPMTLDQMRALEAFTRRLLSSSLAAARPHEEQR